MIDLGQFESLAKISVTSTAPDEEDRFTPDGPEYSNHPYILVASAAVYIKRNGDAANTDILIPANTPVRIVLKGTDTLSYITATTANLHMAKTQ